MSAQRRAALFVALACAACAAKPAVKRGPPLRMSALPAQKARLAAVMWPTAQAIIYCTRRLDDDARPVGVAGPCRRQEAGETAGTKILSWATLGRFDATLPDAAPASLQGRCKLEIEQGQRTPELKPARLTWVTPTHREVLDDWMPTDDAEAVEADGFTLEATFAPEGQWLAVLRVAVGLGDGERVVTVARAKLLKVPACN